MVLSRMPTDWASVAIGSDRATAASMSRPDMMANAVARIPPDTTSGGVAAPMPTIPIMTSSREAPITMPVCTSPRIRPTMGPVTIGRSNICCPHTRPSQMAKPARIPKINALNNITHSPFFTCCILLQCPHRTVSFQWALPGDTHPFPWHGFLPVPSYPCHPGTPGVPPSSFPAPDGRLPHTDW